MSTSSGDDSWSFTSSTRDNRPLCYRFCVEREDIACIRLLHEECFPVTYRDEFYDVLLNATDVNGEPVVSLCCYTRHSDGVPALVGFISARIQLYTEWLFSYTEGYIMTFGVTKGFRRQGIASELLRRMTDALTERHGARRIALHVKNLNREAIDFYMAHGFRIADVEMGFYIIDDRPYDAFLMTRDSAAGESSSPQCMSGVAFMLRSWLPSWLTIA